MAERFESKSKTFEEARCRKSKVKTEGPRKVLPMPRFSPSPTFGRFQRLVATVPTYNIVYRTLCVGLRNFCCYYLILTFIKNYYVYY